MSEFPATPIIDWADRNENPLSLGGKWTNNVFTATDNATNGNLKCNAGGGIIGIGSATGSAKYAGTFTDCEIRCRVNVAAATEFYLLLRGSGADSAHFSGYECNVNTFVPDVEMRRWDNGVSTPMGGGSFAAVVGQLHDEWGFRAQGTKFTIYLNGDQQGQAQEESFTDTTYSSGWIGLAVGLGDSSGIQYGLSLIGGGALDSREFLDESLFPKRIMRPRVLEAYA